MPESLIRKSVNSSVIWSESGTTLDERITMAGAVEQMMVPSRETRQTRGDRRHYREEVARVRRIMIARNNSQP